MSPMFWSAKGRNVSTRTVVIGDLCLLIAVLAVLIVSYPQVALSVLRFAGMYVAPVMAIVMMIVALWFRELGRRDKETARFSYIMAVSMAAIVAILVAVTAYSYSL